MFNLTPLRATATPVTPCVRVSTRRTRCATATSTSAQRSTDARSTHSTTSCAPSPPGPKIDRRDARLVEDRRVHPGRPADHGRRMAEQRARRGRCTSAHDLGVGADLEGRAHERRAHLGAQLGIGLPPPRSTSSRTCASTTLGVLAGDGAALELHEAALGVARQLLAALDQRGVHRAGAEQRVARARRRGAGRGPRCPSARGPLLAIASTPSCGCEPCAARPGDLDLEPGEALVRDARPRARSARSRSPRRRAAARPRPGCRCSRTPRRTRRRRSTSPASSSSAASAQAQSAAAMPPFMSKLPRPYSRSPSTRGSSGRS